MNSVRGPYGDVRDSRRLPVMAKDVGEAERTCYGVNPRGELVFPGTVREVLNTGEIVVDYRFGGEGLELREHLEHRITLPWSPKVLRGTQVIMLRRGLSHGRVLEGLEVRWGGACVDNP